MIDVHVASWPGSAGKPNEDAYVAIEDFVVVADGATAPPSLGTGCIHDPRWYSRQLCTRAAGIQSEKPALPLPAVLSAAIQLTASAHAASCDPTHPGTPSATVAMLRRRFDVLDWLVLGDATLVLDVGEGVSAVCDERLFRSNKPLREAVLRSGLDEADRPSKVAALVDAQRKLRNVEGGFWVAAADPNAAYQSLTGTKHVSTPSRWRAALLTDGAAAAVDTYALTDWAGLLDQLDASGPTALLSSIRKIEADDPDASVYPRIKGSDDATVAYLSGANT